MICPKMSKNVEYCQFKTNKLIGLDQKSRIKTNNYSLFIIYYWLMSNTEQNVKITIK